MSMCRVAQLNPWMITIMRIINLGYRKVKLLLGSDISRSGSAYIRNSIFNISILPS